MDSVKLFGEMSDLRSEWFSSGVSYASLLVLLTVQGSLKANSVSEIPDDDCGHLRYSGFI